MRLRGEEQPAPEAAGKIRFERCDRLGVERFEAGGAAAEAVELGRVAGGRDRPACRCG